MYQFELIPKQPKQKIHAINIDYTPVFNIQLQKDLNVVPSFNQDKQVATPAFILEYEKPYIENNLKYHEVMFDERVRLAETKNRLLLIPKPKHRISICSVCKMEYSDYLTHIYSKLHKKNIQNSAYMQKIRNIATTFSGEHHYKQTEQNQSTEFNLNTTTPTSDETQLFQDNLVKKVKTEPNSSKTWRRKLF